MAASIVFRYVEQAHGSPFSPEWARYVVQKLDDHWEAWIALEVRHDELVPVGVAIGPTKPLAPPLTRRLSKSVRLDDAVRYGRVRARQADEALSVGGWPRLADRETRRDRRSGHPGRGGWGLAYYAELAEDYVDAVTEARGDGRRSVMATLAEARGVTEKTLRRNVAEARRRGLLTPAPPGRAGGDLTPNADRILRARRRMQAAEPDNDSPLLEAGRRGFDVAKWNQLPLLASSIVQDASAT